MERHDLMQLHASHKLELMAHSPQAYRELGRLVAEGVEATEYRRRLEAVLAQPARRGRYANALRHAAGYLPQPDRAEAAALIDGFERGEIDLEAPRAAIRAAVEAHRVDYLRWQTFLRPDSASP